MLKTQAQQQADWGMVAHVLASMDEEYLGRWCRTFWHGDDAVAIVGVFLRWGNHWSGFSVLGEYVVNHPFAFCRQYKQLLQDVFDLFDMERLEVTGLCGHPGIERWMAFLGFEQEGLMKRYGLHGEDAWRYAMVRE